MSEAKEEESTDYLTSEDDLEEQEDPLFGNLNDNKELKVLLSPKKSITEKLIMKTEGVKKGNNKTSDIITQLKRHMKDPLEKELGFSIKDTIYGDGIRKQNTTIAFNKIIESVKRKTEIEEILAKDDAVKLNEANRDKFIKEWIQSHVSNDFLNSSFNSYKINSIWVDNLNQYLNSLILNSSNELDSRYLDAKITENCTYSKLKCFTSTGTTTSDYTDITYIFRKPSIDSLIDSIDISYVEGIKENSIEVSTFNFIPILKKLGFDSALIETDKAVQRTFDDKKPLPYLGCGFQIFKFVKFLELRFVNDKIYKPQIIKILILMSSDYNACNDIKRFSYKKGRFTGKEIALMKIKEFADTKMVNDTLVKLFKEGCVDTWFNFIKSIQITSINNDNMFKLKLIFQFLIFDNVGDNIEIDDDFNKIDNIYDLFNLFCDYVEKLSMKSFSFKNEKYISIVYMKFELIRSFIMMNENTIIQLKNSDNIGRYDILKKSLHKLKNQFFKEDNSFLSHLIPKSKRVLDFTYHALSGEYFDDIFEETGNK